MAKIKYYDSDAIRVSYDATRCIHAAECARGLPAVFDPRRRPWVDPTAAPPDELAEVVRRCPTGALRYDRLDGTEPERPATSNRIVVTPDGPLYVSGDLRLLDAERRQLGEELRTALCRCGASANKPFCDGRHVDTDFRDPGEPDVIRIGAPDEEPAAKLSIRLRENGPLVLQGHFVLTLPSGHTAEGSSCALCRCGASANKPFCDGSHREIGFEPDDPIAESESA